MVIFFFNFIHRELILHKCTAAESQTNLLFFSDPVPSSCLQSEEVPSPQPVPAPQPPAPAAPPAPQPIPATSQYNLTQEQLIRQQLLAKQKQLLELQQKKIELELEQTKAQLVGHMTLIPDGNAISLPTVAMCDPAPY